MASAPGATIRYESPTTAYVYPGTFYTTEQVVYLALWSYHTETAAVLVAPIATVTDTTSTSIHVGTTGVEITGTGFSGTCSVELSVSSGSISQPSSVSVTSTSTIVATLPSVPANLVGAVVSSRVTCDGVTSCGFVPVGTVAEGVSCCLFCAPVLRTA